MAEHIVVITTVADEEGASRLAKALLARRLVACVNIVGGVRSLYSFKGVVEDARECVLLMKTRADHFDALNLALDELHPYDVPELVALDIEKGSEAYLGWIDESVHPRADPDSGQG